jgi:hypothetical protein
VKQTAEGGSDLFVLRVPNSRRPRKGGSVFPCLTQTGASWRKCRSLFPQILSLVLPYCNLQPLIRAARDTAAHRQATASTHNKPRWSRSCWIRQALVESVARHLATLLTPTPRQQQADVEGSRRSRVVHVEDAGLHPAIHKHQRSRIPGPCP